MRVISIGWLLFAVVMISLAWTYTTAGANTSAAPAAAIEATSSLTSTLFGVAALLGIVGPGYSAYRSAMDKLTHTTATPRDPQA